MKIQICFGSSAENSSCVSAAKEKFFLLLNSFPSTFVTVSHHSAPKYESIIISIRFLCFRKGNIAVNAS